MSKTYKKYGNFKKKHLTRKKRKNIKSNLFNVTETYTKGVKTANLVKKLNEPVLYAISPDEGALAGNLMPLFEKELECNKPITNKKTYIDITKDITSLIVKANDKNEKINPRVDFYSFVNSRWEEQQTISQKETYFTKVDSFRVLQDRVYDDLINLVFKYIKENPTKTKQLKNFCDAYINVEKYTGHDNAINAINKIEEYIKIGNLDLFLAYINNNEIISYMCPLVWSIIPDFNNSKIFSCLIDFPSLTLSNYDDYFIYEWDSPKTLKKKNDNLFFFKKYINDVFSFYLGKNHGYNIENVLECEKDIITAANCNSIKSNNESDDPDIFIPYKITIEESKKLGFNWVEFCKAMGFKKIPPYYYTSSINYIKCIMTNLQENWKGKWKEYWIFLYLNTIIRYSSGHSIFHNFKSKYIKGQAGSMPVKKRLIFGLMLGWNKLLTELYILSESKRIRIQYVKNMSIDLKEIFISMIKLNTWLEPKTKKAAIEKLEKLKIIFGSPEYILDYQELNYSNKNAYANLLELTSYRTQVWMDLIDKPVISLSMVDWKNLSLIDTQAYIVNAFYTPNRNDIFIPYAYLQKPFINITERGREYNLAFIGYTLGHEMSHCLDKTGSQYDADGNLRDWWSPKDKALFKRKNDAIVKYYEKAALRDSIKFDANPSVGEDLADLVGTVLVITYLRNFQEFHKVQLLIRNYSFKELFTYLAIQARQSINKRAIQYDLDTNPHPLEKYRVNCVLGRQYLFQKIYGIKKGDPMWINPSGFW